MASVVPSEPTRPSQPQAPSSTRSMLPPMPTTLLPASARRKYCARGWPLKQIFFACLIHVFSQKYFFRAVANHDVDNSNDAILSIRSSESKKDRQRTVSIAWEEERELEDHVGMEDEDDNEEPISYIKAFEQLLPNITWPLNGSYPHIAATFGPAHPYHFHNGVDIRTMDFDSIYAAYDGVVSRIETYKTAGLTIVICHEFDRPVKLHPDKEAANSWFTYYSKLGKTIEGLAKGDKIIGGMKIATMGPADKKRPELHFGLSIGTSCTLAYAVRNPTSKCNEFGFDPHIHPMLLHPAMPIENETTTDELIEDPHMSLKHTQHSTPNKPAVYTITTPSEAPSINYYHVKYISGSNSNVIKSHTFDLNLRIGFDPSTRDALGFQDTQYPHLNPHPFYGNNAIWQMDFVVPWSWLDPSPSKGDVLTITVGDIWNRTVSLGSTLNPYHDEDDIGVGSRPTDETMEDRPTGIEPRPTPLSSVEAIFHVPISFLKGVKDEYAVAAAKKASKVILIPGLLDLNSNVWLGDVSCDISKDSTCDPCHPNDRCVIVDVAATLTYDESSSNLIDTASLIADLHSQYEQRIYEEVHISSSLATNCYAASERSTSTMISLKLSFQSEQSEEGEEMDSDVKEHLEQSMVSFFNDQFSNSPGPQLMTVKTVSLVDEDSANSQTRRISGMDNIYLSDTTSGIKGIDNNIHVEVYMGKRKRTLAGSSELDLQMLVTGEYVGPKPDFSGAIRNTVDSAEDDLINELKCTSNQNKDVCNYFSNLRGIKDTTPPPTNDKDPIAAEEPEEDPEQDGSPPKGLIAVIGVTVLLVGFLCLAVAGLIHLKRRKAVKNEFNDAQSYPSYGIEELEEKSGVRDPSEAVAKKRSLASELPGTQRIPGGFCMGTQGSSAAIKPAEVPTHIFGRRIKEKSSKSLETASHDNSNVSPLDTFSHGGEDWLKDVATVSSRGERSTGNTLSEGEFFQLTLDGKINRRRSEGGGWLDLE